VKIRLFTDERGYPRVDAPSPCEVLGWFIEQDIQSDVNSAMELIEIIDRIQDGTNDYWKGTGNAHTLTLMPKGVHIQSEYAVPPAECEVTLQDLRQSLIDWVEFIKRFSD
jgi:hypothetical protein